MVRKPLGLCRGAFLMPENKKPPGVTAGAGRSTVKSLTVISMQLNYIRFAQDLPKEN